MKLSLPILCCVIGWGSVATHAGSVEFAMGPAVRIKGDRFLVQFSLSASADVEVAVLSPKGDIVRHLAAGVLGGEHSPPFPLVKGLSQSIAWDGKDDYGNVVKNTDECSIRVRAGMGVKLDRIVGGNPYGYYSSVMGQGDHAAWRMMGLEAKPDGTVYVIGNSNIYGPPALRAYSVDGNYLRTVYPPPAGKPVDQMRGWGITVRADGTYTPQYIDVSSPAVSKTFIAGKRGRIAALIPSPGNKELWLSSDLKLMKIHTDGTIPPNPVLEGMLVNEPKPDRLIGQMQFAIAPDRKGFYLAGVFSSPFSGRNRTGADNSGPWRDGQVYYVDYATRTAQVVFALDANTIITDLSARANSPIADAKYGNYAAIVGVAVDADNRLFLCDRQNKRIVIQEANGKRVREIPCEYPDTIAVAPNSKTLFVTTRTGHYHGQGELKLLKFEDWSQSETPTVTIPLCEVRHFSQPTRLTVVESNGQTYVWVAYTTLPVQVYRDSAKGLELVKDFKQANDQWALDVQHMQVDPKTGHVYFADGFGLCFRVTDWANPKFERLMSDKDTPIRGIALAIDERNRWLYTRDDRSPVLRWKLDGGEYLAPARIGDTEQNICTPVLSNDWRIGLGKGDRGFAAAPDGSLATLGVLGRKPDYGGHLRYYHASNKSPWDGLLFTQFDKIRAGGIRFDRQGNLYVAKTESRAIDRRSNAVPEEFASDAKIQRTTGRIYKIAPTGSLAAGSLFPTEPKSASLIYDVPYGSISDFFTRTPRFGVDGYGRIYYPSSLQPLVGVIDNVGNSILSFGEYANRDSLGGLEDDLIPTQGVPMGWPNSVDATDDFVYVSDIVNIRLMRHAKTFTARQTVDIK